MCIRDRARGLAGFALFVRCLYGGEGSGGRCVASLVKGFCDQDSILIKIARRAKLDGEYTSRTTTLYRIVIANAINCDIPGTIELVFAKTESEASLPIENCCCAESLGTFLKKSRSKHDRCVFAWKSFKRKSTNTKYHVSPFSSFQQGRSPGSAWTRLFFSSG